MIVALQDDGWKRMEGRLRCIKIEVDHALKMILRKDSYHQGLGFASFPYLYGYTSHCYFMDDLLVNH